MTDIRARLLAAFATERAEHLGAMRSALDRARAGREVDLRDLFRRAHSLKGAARAVEMPAVEAEAHRLETVLAEVEDGRRALDASTIRLVEAGLDRIEDDGRRDRRAGDDAPAADAALRVTAVDLDRVARSIGGVGAALAPREGAREELAAIAATLHRLAADRSVAAALSSELAREARRLSGVARRLAADDTAALQALDRLDRDARAISVAPAADLLAGLERMVRELASASGKEARLAVEGGEAEADRRVLQALRDPIVHLLRNAIAHGAEPPRERAAAGKPPEMRITLSVERRGGDLVVAVDDDGRGLDRERIARAANLGEQAPDDEALFARLFDQGFSTAGRIDAIAGRGVGLAVVAEAARTLGGTARIGRSDAGGARAEIRVPGTITRQSVLLVEAGGHRFGILGRQVARLLRIRAETIAQVGGELRAPLPGESGGEPARLVPLGAAIGLSAEPPGGICDALVLRDAPRPTALLVDALVSTDRFLIRAADEIATAGPFVTGAILLPDGDVAAVLDPVAIAERRERVAPLAAAPAPRAEAAAAATILVVDDSVTTRTLQRSILEANGYKVVLAVDGVAALELLRARLGEIALVVADVEMPRLDGFGLLHGLRNDPALANIPVIMMTSRNSPDDIRRGFDLGASAYVTKQEFDQGRLLETVARFV